MIDTSARLDMLNYTVFHNFKVRGKVRAYKVRSIHVRNNSVCQRTPPSTVYFRRTDFSKETSVSSACSLYLVQIASFWVQNVYYYQKMVNL